MEKEEEGEEKSEEEAGQEELEQVGRREEKERQCELGLRCRLH